MRLKVIFIASVLAIVVAGCQAKIIPSPVPPPPHIEHITASYYGQGDRFHGKRTASGEVFDRNKLTAAHPSLPFGTRLKISNPRNGRSVIVRVNDRGPHVKGRTLDLSWAAARELGVTKSGVAPLEMEQIN